MCLRRRRMTAAYLPHTRAQNGNTALLIAGYLGRTDCVQLLLDAGADKEAKDEVRCRSAASAVEYTQQPFGYQPFSTDYSDKLFSWFWKCVALFIFRSFACLPDCFFFVRYGFLPGRNRTRTCILFNFMGSEDCTTRVRIDRLDRGCRLCFATSFFGRSSARRCMFALLKLPVLIIFLVFWCGEVLKNLFTL